MNTKFLRRTALALSLSAGVFSVGPTAEAQQPYQSPSRWNNFRPALDEALAAEDALDSVGSGVDAARSAAQSAVEELPAPKGQPAPKRTQQRPSAMSAPSNGAASGNAHLQPTYPTDTHHSGSYSAPQHSYPQEAMPYQSATPMTGQSHGYQAPVHQHAPAHQGTYSTMPSPAHGGSNCSSCQDGSSPSPYANAMSSSWEGATNFGHQHGAEACGAVAGARAPLYPWFGSANLFFFQLEEGVGRPIASGLASPFRTNDLDPDNSVGFDVSAGRYLGCGQYGIGTRFFMWDPSQQSITSQGTGPGSIRAAQPQYRDAFLNFDPVGNGGADTGPENVYDHIDGNSATSDGAYQVRMTRDLQFTGIELNLFSFGLMGAQRASYAGCNQPRIGRGLGWGGGGGRGFGGAAGPLVRANSGRVRVRTSHGIRYLRITDETNVAYGVDLNAVATDPAGPTRVTIFDDLDTENELLGYQFGGMLTYCLGSRLDLNVGGQFGIYGNRATMEHRLGTDTQVAYLAAGFGNDDHNIDTRSSDTVLSTLGELDLGLGFRATNAWTIRGGYRLMGVTGVANAVDSRTVAYNNVADLGQVQADDSYILHGGYFGAEFNW